MKRVFRAALELGRSRPASRGGSQSVVSAYHEALMAES